MKFNYAAWENSTCSHSQYKAGVIEFFHCMFQSSFEYKEKRSKKIKNLNKIATFAVIFSAFQ